MRLGIAAELPGFVVGETCAGVAAQAQDLGWQVVWVRNEADEASVEVVLAIGNPTLYPDLVRRPRQARRVMWFFEPLPGKYAASQRIHRTLPTGRVLDIAADIAPPLLRNSTYGGWREAAAEIREPVANLRQLRAAAHAFDTIVADSQNRAGQARQAGIAADAVPLGYHAAFAGPIATGGPREIDALFFGKFFGRIGRRQRMIEQLGVELGSRGVRLTVHTSDLYGAERRRALEASKVVLDVHRVPGSYSQHRFILATAAGAAFVTEPLEAPQPLVPGTHYLEAPADRLGDALLELAHDEPQRAALVSSAQDLIRGEMSMGSSLPAVLGITALQ